MTPAWKQRLRPASFRGVGFKIEVDTRAGGRRTVLFEFPKRDVPYAEDMGRRARRFSVTGYVIGPDYIDVRDRLIAALEQEGPGLLVHPLLGEDLVQPDPYTVRESRRLGGMAEFEMVFVEAGEAAISISDDTQGAVKDAAANASAVMKQAVDTAVVST